MRTYCKDLYETLIPTVPKYKSRFFLQTKMEKDSKGNRKLFFRALKSLRREKSVNKKQIKIEKKRHTDRRERNHGQMEEIR